MRVIADREGWEKRLLVIGEGEKEEGVTVLADRKRGEERSQTRERENRVIADRKRGKERSQTRGREHGVNDTTVLGKSG